MAFLEIRTEADMAKYLPQVWALLEEAYARVPGGLHYVTPEQVVAKTDVWHLVVLAGRVQAVTLHKRKCGLKLVAMAKARGGRAALILLIRHALRHGWMELSDQAERFVINECGGHRYLIHGSFAHRLLGKVVLPGQEDTFHYRREIMNQLKSKVLLGTPDFARAA